MGMNACAVNIKFVKGYTMDGMGWVGYIKTLDSL